MQREFDPYGVGGGPGPVGPITSQQPAPHGPVEDHSDGAVEQQMEAMRRALNYKSRFESGPGGGF
jgi:hypothetical protein